MPVQKFRSLSEIRSTPHVQPGTEEHRKALNAVFRMAARFAPPHTRLPGVRKYRTLAEAQSDRLSWQRQ